MARTADIVIVGAGINGCSIAYQLARRRAGRILLLEKGTVASGPTGRSSAVVRQHYSVETLAAMARDSVKTFQHFEQDIGGSAGFVQAGVVFLAGAANAPALRSAVEMHQRMGIRATVLSPDELRLLDPALHADDLVCGAYEPDGGYADAALAANSFCEAARQLGVEVLQRTRVTGIRVEGGRVRGVSTSTTEIETPVLVNVAGPWGADVAAMAGVEVPITPSRHPVVLMQRPPQWRADTPVWGDLVNEAYFKPEGHGNILVGSISAKDADTAADPESYAETPEYEEISTLAERIMRRFPAMHDGLARGGWAGIYDVTPDWMPVIDRIDGIEGFYCAVGFSGHGFKLSPAVGTLMSELVLDGESKTYDASVFRWSRFEEGRLTKSGYAQSIIG